MKKSVQFSLSERTVLLLKAYSAKHDVPMSTIVTDAVEEYALKEKGIEELIELLKQEGKE